MFEDSITDEMRSRYMLLELDTFYFPEINKNIPAYCLIESAPIQEMINVDKNLNLHENLVKNYKLRNWKYCEDALEHLIGKWNQEVDSFYETMSSRIKSFKENDPGDQWNPVINFNS